MSVSEKEEPVLAVKPQKLNSQCRFLFDISVFIMSQTCLVSGIMNIDFRPLQERDICRDDRIQRTEGIGEQHACSNEIRWQLCG